MRKALTPGREGFVCQFCLHSARPLRVATAFALPFRDAFEPPRRQLGTQRRRYSNRKQLGPALRLEHGDQFHSASNVASAAPNETPESQLRTLTRETKAVIASSTLPREEDLVHLLLECHKFSKMIMFGKSDGANPEEHDDSPHSTLLDLEEDATSKRVVSSSAVDLPRPFRQRAADTMSDLMNELMSDPKIFITPPMLEIYVRIQVLLGRPDYIPQVFHMYATKPIPEPRSNPITYRAANPKGTKNAIPTKLADAALEAAIAKKNLPLALAVIDTTFCAPAFYRNKIFRKAGLPILGFSLTPVAAYAGASYFADNQDLMDHSTMMGIAFSGILAYVAITATLGAVSVATQNDQMERVVWVPGMPLRQRWLREEERAAFDKVAIAWGFKDVYRRGEEEGPEWEALKEFCGLRGMILDKTDLMEGME